METIKVLVIDDDQDMRMVVNAIVSSNPAFSIACVDSGSTGLEKAASYKPDIVFIDYHLQDMTGLIVLDKLMKSNPDVQAIILTSDNTQALAIEAFRHGAVDFVSKPFDHEYLMLVAERAAKTVISKRELNNSKELCLAAEHQRKEAQESWRRERDFLANMSHELRTPAQIIHTTLSLTKDELKSIYALLNEAKEIINQSGEGCSLRLREIINTISAPLAGEDDFSSEKLARIEADILEAQNAANRLRNTTTRILDLAKLTSGQVEFMFCGHDISELVESVAKSFRSSAEDKHIKLHLNVSSKIIAEIDRTFMEQVIANILSNAIKFTPREGEITVSVSEISGIVSISVADSGAGIPVGEEKLIFERFHQTSQSAKQTDQPGTGLGLAICQIVILKHNGIIYATHNHPQGLIINIELPKTQTGIANNHKEQPGEQRKA